MFARNGNWAMNWGAFHFSDGCFMPSPVRFRRRSSRPSVSGLTRLPVSLGKKGFSEGMSRSPSELGSPLGDPKDESQGARWPQELTKRRCRMRSPSCHHVRSSSRRASTDWLGCRSLLCEVGCACESEPVFQENRPHVQKLAFHQLLFCLE